MIISNQKSSDVSRSFFPAPRASLLSKFSAPSGTCRLSDQTNSKIHPPAGGPNSKIHVLKGHMIIARQFIGGEKRQQQ